MVTPFARGEGVDSVCNERCRELLSCGHPCQGFCGEKCPSICVRCRANDDYGVDSRFIELDCGHAFESDFLLTNIMRVGKGTRVPACPTCGETVSGVYRYSSLMRESLRSLEQETLLQLEEQLCREVTADEGPVHPQIEELSEMLVSRPGLKPTILLLIGKLYVQVGSLASARKHLTEALEACPVTIWVRIELLTCLGYLNLSGDSTEDDFPVRVKKSSDLKLAAALAFFNDAQSSCAVESMSRGVFCRTSLSTAEVVAIIGQELIRRRAATRATSLAAEAAKREFIILSSAALPIEQSWHLFPSVAMPQPLFTEVRTTGGTPLHKAASEGNLKKVIDRFLDCTTLPSELLHIPHSDGVRISLTIHQVRSLVDKGEDTVKQDDFGNTALLCAVENRNFVVAAYLAEISPWHVVNKAQRTFLNAVDIVACIGEDNEAAKTILLDLSKKV